MLTRYEKSTVGRPNGLETHFPAYNGFTTHIEYDGTEGRSSTTSGTIRTSS